MLLVSVTRLSTLGIKSSLDLLFYSKVFSNMVSISRRLSTSKPCTKMVHHVNSVSRWETHWRFNNLVNMGLLWLVGIVFCSSSTFLLCTVHLNSQYLLVIFLFGVSEAVSIEGSHGPILTAIVEGGRRGGY